MTAQELNTYINRVLGNSIRCLLPSYWWKRLLTRIVEYVDSIEENADRKIAKVDNKVEKINDKVVSVEDTINDIKENISNVDLSEILSKSEASYTYATKTELEGKVSKDGNKQLSEEDFTLALKQKLDGLNNYDDTEISEAINQLREDFDNLVDGDSSTAIKTFNEIIAFLEGVEDSEDLSNIISAIEQQIAAKQDKINDLEDIRTGAAKGKTSVQKVKINGTEKTPTSGVVDLGTVITSHQDISGKVDKVDGKGLSTNDYTTTEKNKLAGIASGAEVNVQSDWSVTDTTSDAYIKNKPTIPSAVSESTVSGWGFTKNTGTYSKPSGGIPKSDLASAVQTSLGKADTALQSYTEQYKGTVTSITMNDSTKNPDTNGVVDLGTVLTSHLDISGKLDKTEASNTYVTKQELILNIDPYNTDGIYAVTQDGDLVSYDRANESCIGVVLVKGDHKFMIAKNDALLNSTFLWMYPISDLELTNYETVDGVNTSGAFFDQSKTQLSTDYKTWTAGALSDFNGKENSTIIASVASRTNEMGSALKAFNSGSTTDNNYGLDDWYIPALGQLALIRIHLDEINEFFVKIGGSVFGSSYWSSSEESYGLAWQISFNSSSTVGSSNKDMHNKCVRFIRDFSIKEPISKTSLLLNDSNYIVDYDMFPDGVYAVTNNLTLVSKEKADESCIGVAFIQGEHRYMISKYDSDELVYWGYNLNIDIPDITNYETVTEAELDFNGYNNTKAILNAYITYDKTINEKDMCYVLNAFNVKSESQLFDDWYIPAYGLLHIMLPFLNELNTLFNKINGNRLTGIYLTSSEKNAYTGLAYTKFNGGSASPSKQYTRYVRFIRDLKSIKEELNQQTQSIREEFNQQTLSISTLQDNVAVLQDNITVLQANLYKPLITSNSNKAHLLPNKYYRVNTKGWSGLTITLEPESNPDVLNEYFIEFAIGSSTMTISLPDGIKWVNGEIPLFFTDTTYLISIVNNLGIVTSFK